MSLGVTTSQQEWGPWGVHSKETGVRRSLRSSPDNPGIRLANMSEDTEEDAIKLHFHLAAPRICVKKLREIRPIPDLLLSILNIKYC